MAGPAALLLLGGLLGGLPKIWGVPGGSRGGSETPPELEEEVWIVQRSEPQPPHCFTRTLHDLSCFWDSPGEPDPRRYRLLYRLEQDPWQECPLAVSPGGVGARFWCRFPEAATVTFVPLELRVLPGTPPGTPPETTGTTERPPETTGTTESSPKTAGTTKTTPETTGTTERPPETTGTTRTHLGTTETTETPPKISETTETPPVTTGTTRTPLKITETPPGTTKSPPETTKTTKSPPETTGTPPKISDITKTNETAPGSTKDVETPPKISGTPPKWAGPPPTPLFQKTIFIDQVVLPGPPQNVSVSPGGARGELCVRWAPPPGPYLHSSLVFELALSPPGGPPKIVGVPAGRREQGVGGLRGSTPYSVRARARPDGISYGGFWSPWSPPATATTPPELDAVTLGLSCLLVLLLLGLGVLGLLGHRRTLQAKLWPPVPGPEREFEGLFSNFGGNFQLWLCQGPGFPWAPPAPPPLELEDAVEEVGGGSDPPLPPGGPSPPPQPWGPEPPPQAWGAEPPPQAWGASPPAHSWGSPGDPSPPAHSWGSPEDSSPPPHPWGPSGDPSPPSHPWSPSEDLEPPAHPWGSPGGPSPPAHSWGPSEGPDPPAQAGGPSGGPSPSPSFEYTLFEPGSALLCPPPPGPAPYANLAPPPKPAPPLKPGGHAPHYVICS